MLLAMSTPSLMVEGKPGCHMQHSLYEPVYPTNQTAHQAANQYQPVGSPSGEEASQGL
jgi:hypothetical protein